MKTLTKILLVLSLLGAHTGCRAAQSERQISTPPIFPTATNALLPPTTRLPDRPSPTVTAPAALPATEPIFIRSPSLTPTLVPELPATAARTPTPTPAPSAVDIAWAAGITNPIFLDYPGVWSPTSNEVLTQLRTIDFTQSPVITGTLAIASAPDFRKRPLRVTGSDLGEVDVLRWTPDGSSIVYSSYIGIGNHQLDTNTLWIVDRDGRIRRKLLEEHVMDWIFGGWMNEHVLAISSYGQGEQRWMKIVDTRTGLTFASVNFMGFPFPANAAYAPIFLEYDDPLTLEVVSAADRPFEGGWDDWGKVLPFPKENLPLESRVYFRDWLPGKNQMLVHTFQQSAPYDWDTANRNGSSNSLLLWDVDQDTYRELVPGAFSGRFSPDGRLLASLSVAPFLKVKSHLYLDLLDMRTGKNILRLPVVERFREDGPAQVYWSRDNLKFPLPQVFAFSSDSRYLAFLTPGKIQTDETGWPVDVVASSEGVVYQNVLDLSLRKLVWSAPASANLEIIQFGFSHTGKWMIYLDSSSNWSILSLSTWKSSSLTLDRGDQLMYPIWSFDDQYLLFRYRIIHVDSGNPRLSYYTYSGMIVNTPPGQ